MMIDEDKDILLDFREKLPIDRLELERECCEQAIIYDEVGSWVAMVKADAKIAKEHISFVESEISLDIRKNPELFDLPAKSTVDAVKSTVAVNKKYQKAVKDYIEADKLASEAITLLTAVEQRKSGLRDLVRLYINNYYSTQEDVVDTSGWEAGEAAIQELRAKKIESSEDFKEDNKEE